MKASEFCYWLQGYFEINGAIPQEPGAINSQQSATIQRHLALVFAHELDKQHGDANEQAMLQAIHDAQRPKLGQVGDDGAIYRC